MWETRIDASHLLNPSEFELQQSVYADRNIFSVTRKGKNYYMQQFTDEFESARQRANFITQAEDSFKLASPVIHNIVGVSLSNFLGNNYPAVFFEPFGNDSLADLMNKKPKKWTNTHSQMALIGITAACMEFENKHIEMHPMKPETIYFDDNLELVVTNYGVFDYFWDKDDDSSSSYDDQYPISMGELGRSYASACRNILSLSYENHLNRYYPIGTPRGLKSELMKFFSENPADFPSYHKLLEKLLTDQSLILPDVDMNKVRKYAIKLKRSSEYPIKVPSPFKEKYIPNYISRKVLCELINSDDIEDLTHTIIKCQPPKWYYERVIFPVLFKQSKLSYPLDLFVTGNNEIVPEEHRSKFSGKNVSDLLFIANSYRKGENGFQNSDQASWVYFKMASKMGSPEAHFRRGSYFMRGIAVVQDLAKAKECMKTAKKMNVRNAHFSLVNLETEIDKENLLLKNLNKNLLNRMNRAANGDIFDILYVAFSLLHGLNGYPKIPSQAKKLYKIGACASPDFDYILGYLYHKGIGFPKNDNKAYKHFHLAAVHGCNKAKYIDQVYENHQYVFQKENLDNIMDNIYTEVNSPSDVDQSLFIPSVDSKNKLNHLLFNPNLTFSLCKKNDFHPNSIELGVDYELIKSGKDFHNSMERQKFLFAVGSLMEAASDQGFSINSFLKKPCFYSDNHYPCITSAHLSKGLESRNIEIALFGDLIKLVISNIEPLTGNEEIYEFMDRCRKGPEYPTFKEIPAFLSSHILSSIGDDSELFDLISDIENYVPWSSNEIMISNRIDTALKGNLEDQIYVGKSYFHGDNGYPVNIKEAFKFFSLAKGNDIESKYMCGYITFFWNAKVGDNETGLLDLINASEEGNLDARYRLAQVLGRTIYNDEFYDFLHSNDKDEYLLEQKPVELLRECAEKNHAKAMFQYARILESSVNKVQGRKESLVWYERAARLGHIESLKRLYHILRHLNDQEAIKNLMPIMCGLNEPKYFVKMAELLTNLNEKEEYLQKAIELKYAPSYKAYGDILNAKGDFSNAMKFYSKASFGEPKAVTAVANMLAKGIGCTPNLARAKRVFQKAIEYNDSTKLRMEYANFIEPYDLQLRHRQLKNIIKSTEAKEYYYLVAHNYLKGNGVKKNIPKGIEIMHQALDAYDTRATYYLGKIYYFGKYIAKNQEQGLKYLQIACEEQNPKALHLLGKIYFKGIGVTKNVIKAAKYLVQGARNGNVKAKYYCSKPVFYKYYWGKFVKYFAKKVDYQKSYWYNPHLYFVDKAESELFLKESAEAGYYKAQFAYGLKLIDDIDNTECLSKGLEFIEKSAENPHKYKKAIKFIKKYKKDTGTD